MATNLLPSDEQRIRNLRDYALTVKRMSGPLDDNYTSTFVLKRDEFLDDLTPEVRALRERIGAQRAAAEERYRRGQ